MFVKHQIIVLSMIIASPRFDPPSDASESVRFHEFVPEPSVSKNVFRFSNVETTRRQSAQSLSNTETYASTTD